MSCAVRNDRDVVLAAVGQYGWALEYASDELRIDPEMLEELHIAVEMLPVAQN